MPTVQPHHRAVARCSNIKKNKLLICATTWINLQRIMLKGEKKVNLKRFHTVLHRLYNSLDMIKFQKWRTDEWLSDAKEGVAVGVK